MIHSIHIGAWITLHRISFSIHLDRIIVFITTAFTKNDTTQQEDDTNNHHKLNQSESSLHLKFLCFCYGFRKRIKTTLTGDTSSCGCFRRDRVSGKNNPNYNPDLTDEERHLNNNRHLLPETYIWKQAIKKQYNHTCKRCNQIISQDIR